MGIGNAFGFGNAANTSASGSKSGGARERSVTEKGGKGLSAGTSTSTYTFGGKGKENVLKEKKNCGEEEEKELRGGLKSPWKSPGAGSGAGWTGKEHEQEEGDVPMVSSPSIISDFPSELYTVGVRTRVYS